MSEADSMQADESLKSSVKSAKAQVDGLKELVPQQLSDEIKLGTTLLKSKGIRLGVAAGLAAGALVVVSLFVVAVVVTLVNVLAIWFQGWAAALIVAGFFLLVAAILALVIYLKVKKALPLTPEAAIRGLRHDIGVIKDGSNFDVSTLDEPMRKKDESEESAKDKKKEPKPPAPTADELVLRTKRRRRQIQALRDNLGQSVLGPKAKIDKARQFAENAGDSVTNAAAKARSFVTSSVNNGENSEADRAGQERVEKAKPFAIIAASAGALVAIIRKLVKRS
ncbi:hypothetical protein CQ017_10915 [Arthrobacter sp. MYb224]|uniref:phage holin family protein n=1 Tax=Arthrobacter sp. MYb224 TaxID=1848600 RepID=UPI000CFCF434|nr:phage holin family protein [Arthrobacter sp. MYb224]PQZ98127.1 hypothetical protein CQ017_10915 [Arthrobacter sp. MYb224]